MKVHAAKEIFIKELLPIIGDEKEIEAQFWILFEQEFNIDRLNFAINRNIELAENEIELFYNFLKELIRGRPIQYVLGKAYFYGMSFKVGEGVLIPRPETEELVEWIVRDNEHHKQDILDIATGSGCIPIALQSSKQQSDIYAFDYSQDALKYAKENNLLVKNKVKFFQSDALNIFNDDFLKEKKWDIIVSNPPYILQSEIDLMKSNVVDFEPHLALFVKDNNPLLFYDKIMDYAFSNLKDGAKLYFEINEQFPDQIKELSNEKGFKSCEVREDFRGKARMVKIIK